MKKKSALAKNQLLVVIFGAIIIGWLVALTSFTIWAWNQHIWQAKADNENIYQLYIRDGKQQESLDSLQK